MSIDQVTGHPPLRTLSVLVISPPPSVHGGVTAFVETMKPHFKHCAVTSFWVGSAQDGNESAVSKLWRVIAAPFQIASLVRKEKIDVVHINPSLDMKSGMRDGFILLVLRLAGFRRTMVYMHGWQTKVEQALRRTPLLRPFTRWLLGGAGHIMVLAPEFKTGLVAMGIAPANITFTHTMFDGTDLKSALANAKPATRRTILFMSRFEQEKGVYELLEAFTRLAHAFPDVDLVFAGDGHEMKGLRQKVEALRIAHRVTFTGYIRGLPKAELLCSATVFALPTYFPEGMPVALLEAMGAGKPVLTAPVGGIAHIINDPENGVLLEKVTTDSVEAALRRLLSDASYCERTGERNRDYAWKTFEAESVTAEIEAIYNRIATQ